MIRMVIVDDETLVREGLRHFVDWGSIGVTVISTASDGEAALKLIEAERPDIVLTDIQMPGLNGIEMVAALKRSGIHAHVVFISAYSSFEYAQNAVKLGAFDYILKPINEQAVLETIGRLSSLIGQSRDKSEGDAGTLLASLRENQPLGKSEQDLVSRLAAEGLKSAVAVVVRYEGDPPVLPTIPCDRLLSYDDGQGEWILLALDRREPGDLEQRALNALSVLTTGWASLSRAHLFPEGLIKLPAEMGYPLIFEGKVSHSVLRFAELWNAEPIARPGVERLLNAVQIGLAGDALEQFDHFFLSFTSGDTVYDTDALKLLCVALLDRVLSALRWQDELGPLAGGERLSAKKGITRERTIDRVYQVCSNILKNLSDAISGVGQKSSHRLVSLAESHIKREYAGNLSLYDLAERLYVSPKYLSKIFREVTGEPFSRYLMRYRIEQAKKLLRDSRYKVYEIAEMTGFTDIAHFSKTFKLLTGASPTVFQNAADPFHRAEP